jgi:ribose/xylose/arabinose/galactoside ABC-type transport system permease subunit
MTNTNRTSRSVRGEKSMRGVKTLGPWIALGLLVVIFTIMSPCFFTVENLRNILSLLPVLLITSLGITFTITLGGIDLSAEGIMALCSVLVGFVVANQRTMISIGFWSIPLATIIGAAMGSMNGVIHVKGRIPSFMTTLGLGYAANGLAVYLIKGNPIPLLDRRLQAFVTGSTMGIPNIALIGFIAFLVAYIIIRWTSVGRYIFSVGGDETISRQMGISVGEVKIIGFALAGAFYGLAGFLNTARLASASAATSVGYQFAAITATVVGGTALTGGVGGASSALVGSLIVTVLQNGMILLGINPYVQSAIHGMVLIAAVTLTLDRQKLPVIK